ncbi:methyl-accepting chemotaxis protein [Pelomonas sp. APW6]|uniref:Methyl-accepting chemotaxis protein n=1 Tax=Roseateles subflavus TaxID=3053353 RepID=A0ABT7LF19_9BURK|nr:methyl-accepting chemotaxis protein [Pelomonas sp. APW6]MDL5031442.1 methyl-accepting chemotaxis protein [Pelomonas sp. APW6]
MEFLRTMRIGARLGLAFGAMLLLMLTLSVLGWLNSRRMHDQAQELYLRRALPMQQIGAIDTLMLRNRLLVMEMMRDPQPGQVEALDQQLKANVAQVTETWKRYVEGPMDGEEKALADRFAQTRSAYVKQGLLAARDLLKQGDSTGAEQVYQQKIQPLGREAKASIDQLIATQVQGAKQAYDALETLQVRVQWWSASLSSAAVLLTVLGALACTRSIVRPLAQAVQLARQVAAGDLREQVPSQGRDEAHELLEALNAMASSLSTMVQRVRDSSETIATGSSQIATGSADLSQRTEEQASNLQQTAASMEQLSGTVTSNAETASEADRLAREASSAAALGGDVVTQVVRNMQGIADSSRRIADIISVIDGIAFQTNILALNAAVEAARAGEQGRGFAVVAGEVRALAQRSAQAAREIKSLIGQSVEQVDQGNRLVEQAGQSMTGIVAQVQQVSALIGEIASASQEQSKGIAQVGAAVTQLDHVTQQNAALVEESTAAAESLQHQAQRLAELVSEFKTA